MEMPRSCERGWFGSGLRPASAERRSASEVDGAEASVSVFVGAGGEEKFVSRAVVGSAAAEGESPELIDGEGFSGGVLELAEKCAGVDVEGVDATVRRVVADQQRAAEGSEIPGRERQAPGLIQNLAIANQALEQDAGFAEDVDEAAGGSVSGEGDIDFPVDVLDAVGREAGGNRGIREVVHNLERAVVNVDAIVCDVGGIEELDRGRWVADSETGVDGVCC